MNETNKYGKHQKNKFKVKGILCLASTTVLSFFLQHRFVTNVINLEGTVIKDTSTHAVNGTSESKDGVTVNGNASKEDVSITKFGNSLKNVSVHYLKCDDFGGPDNLRAAEEMVYWSDIPSDSTFVSPFKRDDAEQYVTYEPDYGAFNNMRMTWENVVVFAIVTGRTLVLLPEREFPYITDVSVLNLS